MPTIIVSGSSDVSLSFTSRTSTLGIYSMSIGTNHSKGILGSHPNIICQICHAPSYPADACPSYHQPLPQSVLSAYATFNSVDAGEQFWYPDCAVTSCMTLGDDKLLSKSLYSGTSLIKVGNGILLPIKHVGYSSVLTPFKPLHLSRVIRVPNLAITCYLFANCVVTTTVV